jgi:hypothetical protein
MEKGWIKLHRREHRWFEAFTDQEVRYYLIARMFAVWDKRSRYFGTFDARTRIVRGEMLPGWSTGKINMVKNSLLKKAAFQKTSDARRLKVTNANIFLWKGRVAENLIQESTDDLHVVERDFQSVESQNNDIRTHVREIGRIKRTDFDFDSIF